MNEELLKILLLDRTTGKNILWANSEFGAQEIQAAQVYSIKPRYEKVRELQKLRTKARAEIFTPPEICALQNDLFDTVKRTWTEYIDAKFLEITCGEAPYLVSRYNAVTGDTIPLVERRGLLDRKFNVISNHATDEYDWIKWAGNALCSVYGYEFQGDNLFLARRNVFDTVIEYFTAKFTCKPPENFWLAVATIISWNLWQMDGLTYSPPFMESANLFGGANCKIMDWRTGKVMEFGSLVGRSDNEIR